jgi:hypothetical protein
MKEFLTNENLKGLCASNFDLAHRAIELARYYIRAGHETSIDAVLDDLRRDPHGDYLRELEEIDRAESAENAT